MHTFAPSSFIRRRERSCKRKGIWVSQVELLLEYDRFSVLKDHESAKHQEQPVVKNGCSVETKPEVDIVKQEVQENLVGPSVTEVRPRVLRGGR
jgi:hypothetical protein